MSESSLFTNLINTMLLKNLILHGPERPPVEVPLNPTQERVLMMIWHRGALTMSEISGFAGLEKGSITSVIDYLANLGLLSRVRSETDLRSYSIYLTLAGIRQAEIVEDFFNARIASLFSRLDDQDRGALVGALETLGRLIPVLKGEINDRQ